MIIGAASAKRTQIVGGPFGPQLDRLLKRAGLSRQHFEIGTLTAQATSAKAVLAFGERALQDLVGEVGILRWRGRVVQSRWGQWVVPTFDPGDLLPKRGKDSYGALRNPPRFTGAVLWDIQRALRVAEEGFKRSPVSYLCDPSPPEFWGWVTRYEALGCPPLSFDIETPYKLKEKDESEFEESQRDNLIIRISFSYESGTGVSIPWDGRYLSLIKRVMASPGIKVGWNCDGFDVPLIRAQGVAVEGEIHDAMWLWHLYQSDLPMGLEFVTSFWSDLLPWKHLNNSDPVLYSAIDADAALRNYLGLKEATTRTGQWATFMRHIVKLDPVLYEAGANGSQIDLAKQASLKILLTDEKETRIAKVQALVPEHLKPRKRYKKLPKEGVLNETGSTAVFSGDWERKWERVNAVGKLKRCTHCGAEGVKKATHFKGGKKNPCKVAGAKIEIVDGPTIEWDEILPFNPNSTEQLKSYIRFFKHPMGRAKDDKDKEAADSRHLDKLRKRYGTTHPLYGITIDIHKVCKALSTYVDGYVPDHLGLIHTSYGHTPSTWRLSSRNVNLQNVGKRGGNPWAKDARKQIIPRKGHVFVQADSSAIEAVLVGYFMGSPDYINLARRGVHDFLACRVLGWEFNPLNQQRVKDDQATLRDQCKITVHGTSYGMTPKLMVELFPDLFVPLIIDPTRPIEDQRIAEAKKLQDFFFQVVPGLKPWQNTTRMRAHRETFLENPWKIRHYFYHVFMQDSFGNVSQGGDANRCIAFLPQSAAGCFMKDNLVLLGETWLRPYIPAHVSVHDSLCVDVPERMKERAVDTLVEILTRPIPEMGGLQVGCEVEIGMNWGEMKRVKVVSV